MIDSRSISEIGATPGPALPGADVSAVARHSSSLMVSAWLSTSFLSRRISAFMSTKQSLPLGRNFLAGILPGSPREIGEDKVKRDNASELNERS